MTRTEELHQRIAEGADAPRAGVALAGLAVWMLRVTAALLLASPLLVLALLLL